MHVNTRYINSTSGTIWCTSGGVYECKYKVHKFTSGMIWCTYGGVYETMMYLWWSLVTLYLNVCQVRLTLGDSGLCCCPCVINSLECWFCAAHAYNRVSFVLKMCYVIFGVCMCVCACMHVCVHVCTCVWTYYSTT